MSGEEETENKNSDGGECGEGGSTADGEENSLQTEIVEDCEGGT